MFQSLLAYLTVSLLVTFIAIVQKVASHFYIWKENALKNQKDRTWKYNFPSSNSVYLLEPLLHLNSIDQSHLWPPTALPEALFKHSQGLLPPSLGMLEGSVFQPWWFSAFALAKTFPGSKVVPLQYFGNKM